MFVMDGAGGGNLVLPLVRTVPINQFRICISKQDGEFCHVMSSAPKWITQYGRNRIEIFKHDSEYSTLEKIAEELGLSRGRFSALLNAQEPIVDERRILLNHLLSVLPCEDELMYSTDQSFAKNGDPPAMVTATPLRAQQGKTDLKTLLTSHDLSVQILSNQYPSLHQIFIHSFGQKFPSDHAKNQPHFPGFNYNHFIQVGIIFPFAGACKGERAFVGYYRAGSRFEHTKGASFIWGASFECNPAIEKTPEHSIVDNWISLVGFDKDAAKRQFLDSKTTILRNLFRYKIAIEGRIESITPFGVITRDERSANNRKCYTTYIFEAVMQSATNFRSPFEALKWAKQVFNFHDISPLILVGSGGALSWRSVEKEGKETDEEVFTTDKGRLNEMDIAAWRALRSPVKAIDFKQARFHPGFDLF
jgi:hypothetical protein